MLEKILENNEIIYCDAHFHLADCVDNNCFDSKNDIIGCSCFHSPKEWRIAGEQAVHDFESGEKNFIGTVRSFGIHPQNPDLSFLSFLENLLEENKIQAVGECGFDFYKSFLARYSQKIDSPQSVCDLSSKSFLQSPNLAVTEIAKIQEEAFLAQIRLAQKYNKPVVIHCRKANEKLFDYSKELKKLPSVLFHSFMGTLAEAKSLLNRGINGYFSFGKQIFNGNKKAIQCVRELPLERLLLETDAPFQTLKGEEKTFSSEIKKVYFGAFRLRFGIENLESYPCSDENNRIEENENKIPKDLSEKFFDFAKDLKRNFTACFCNP